jgi:ribose 5-phosphate isomerase B
MSVKTIAIGCDHAGFILKNPILYHLRAKGYNVLDFGAFSDASADYADFAHPTASAVEHGEADLGVLICGSGNGIAITANKHQQIRCALCWLPEIASLARQHNNANMIALPARFVSLEAALEMVDVFIATEFEGGRHAKRVEKMACV